jgi:hypothetical protein
MFEMHPGCLADAEQTWFFGVCSTDLRLDTSTNNLKQVYTSLQAIYYKKYFFKRAFKKNLQLQEKKVFVPNKYNT